MPYKFNAISGLFDYYETVSGGSSIPGMSANEVLYMDSSATLAGDASFKYFDTFSASGGVDEAGLELTQSVLRTVDVGTVTSLTRSTLTVTDDFIPTNDGSSEYAVNRNVLKVNGSVDNTAFSIASVSYYSQFNQIYNNGIFEVKGSADTSVVLCCSYNYTNPTQVLVPTDGDSPNILVYGAINQAAAQITVNSPATPYLQYIGTYSYAFRGGGATPNLCIGGDFISGGGTLNYGVRSQGTTAAFSAVGHYLPASNNLYDLGSSSLRIRKLWSVDVDLSGSLVLSAVTANRALYTAIGGTVTNSANFTFNGNQLGLAAAGTGGGILIGGDFQIYRSAADEGRTPDGWVVDGTSAYGGAGRDSRFAINVSRTTSTNESGMAVNASNTLTGSITSQFPGGGAFAVSINAGANTIYYSTGVFFSTRTETGQSGAISEAYGGDFDLWHRGTANITTWVGARGFMTVRNTSTGTISTAEGFRAIIDTQSGGTNSNVTTASGFTYIGSHNGPATFGTVDAFKTQWSSGAGSGAVTKFNHFKINDISTNTTCTTQTGIRLQDLDQATTNYAIYLEGTSGLERQGIWWNGDSVIHRYAANVLSTGVGDSFRSDTGFYTSLLRPHTTVGGSTTNPLTIRGRDAGDDSTMGGAGTNVTIRAGDGSTSKPTGAGGNLIFRLSNGAPGGTIKFFELDGTSEIFGLNEGVGAVFNEGGDSLIDFRVEGDTLSSCFFLDASADSIQMFGASASFGGGVGVLGITNAVTVPSSNPTGGGVLYAEAGAIKWRGSSGTVTTMAPA